jgi:uncharacterized SAM-binding protein YcdF (DUF218 family)
VTDRPAAAQLSPAMRRRRRIVLGTALVIVLALAAATARLFVWPAQGMPARVDAIVMLDGSGSRLPVAVALARAHRAPMLVISQGTPQPGQGSACGPRIAGVRVICFHPDPPTTRGEAEFVGRLASSYHWHSIALITSTPQLTPAGIRIGYCYPGRTYKVAAPLSAAAWPPSLLYEWIATVSAEVQHSC